MEVCHINRSRSDGLKQVIQIEVFQMQHSTTDIVFVEGVLVYLYRQLCANINSLVNDAIFIIMMIVMIIFMTLIMFVMMVAVMISMPTVMMMMMTGFSMICPSPCCRAR